MERDSYEIIRGAKINMFSYLNEQDVPIFFVNSGSYVSYFSSCSLNYCHRFESIFGSTSVVAYGNFAESQIVIICLELC